MPQLLVMAVNDQTTLTSNGHLLGKPGLADLPIDSQSPVILNLSILTVHANSSHPCHGLNFAH